MTLQGKGFLIFNLPDCQAGDPAAILTLAQEAGLSHVLIRVADGGVACGVDAAGSDSIAPVVQTLRAGGIAAWGWHPIHGNEPSIESAVAIQRAQALGLDGYVVVAREEFHHAGMHEAALQFMSAIRAALNIPLALSSYHFPNYHPELPWSTFLEFCDLHMPQVTWEQAHDPVEQLHESRRQCDALPNARPYIPTGAAYATSGWSPTPEETTEFLNTAMSSGLSAVNFYNWDACHDVLPQVWQAIADFAWPAPSQLNQTPSTPPAPFEEFLFNFLGALNSRQAARMAPLYRPDAVQVWAEHIRRDTNSIQAGYDAFFASLPAGTIFSISQARTLDDRCSFTWQAGVLGGDTTVVLQDGKIALEYTLVS
jgi:hypothetical protein